MKERDVSVKLSRDELEVLLSALNAQATSFEYDATGHRLAGRPIQQGDAMAQARVRRVLLDKLAPFYRKAAQRPQLMVVREDP